MLSSVAELRAEIRRYIDAHNLASAKPIRLDEVRRINPRSR
jgi:hypothetical protein